MTADKAMTEFPELQRLADLRKAGWQFVPVTTGGEMVELRGVRIWPDDSVDAIVVRFTTDAAGLRYDPSGDVVWRREGYLADVINGLFTLPPPSDRPGRT